MAYTWHLGIPGQPETNSPLTAQEVKQTRFSPFRKNA
jgi:hypothetical protein